MSEPSASTTVMVGRCLDDLRQRRPEAKDRLLRFAQDRLLGHVRAKLASRPRLRRWEQSGDVLQEVLIRLDRAIDDLDVQTPRQFFALAALQIRRVLIDLGRHHFGPEGAGRHHGTRIDVDRDPVEAAPAPGGFAAVDDFGGPRVHEVVERLAEEHREVFDLLFYCGLTQPVAAELLGTSERTIRRRWRAARVALGSELENPNALGGDATTNLDEPAP